METTGLSFSRYGESWLRPVSFLWTNDIFPGSPLLVNLRDCCYQSNVFFVVSGVIVIFAFLHFHVKPQLQNSNQTFQNKMKLFHNGC